MSASGAPPLARTNSLFGTFKTIVSAPLNWLSPRTDEASAIDTDDSSGKRRRAPSFSATSADNEEEVPNRQLKRLRLNSRNSRSEHSPYLDPPRHLFNQKQQNQSSPRGTNSRIAISPGRNVASRFPRAVSRTMSMDPPSLIIPESSPTHERSLASFGMRDPSLSPNRSQFRVRTSLTPQPSRASQSEAGYRSRYEGVGSEPPPQSRTAPTFHERPSFYRPPNDTSTSRAHSVSLFETPATLGALLQSQRTSLSPTRRNSSILFATSIPSDDVTEKKPATIAGIAFHDLEIYKTPLLPSRLKNAGGIPAIFETHSRKPAVARVEDFAGRPRHRKDKVKKVEQTNGTKPYAGSGGMKRLLARRQAEKEAEEQSRIQTSAATHEKDSAIERLTFKTKGPTAVDPVKDDTLTPLRVIDSGPLRSSSLRVGRSVRSHIDRPSVGNHKNRFTANFDDEEPVQFSQERIALEEAAKKVPVFEMPSNLSFPSAPPAALDSNKAKEPPMQSLPFSFSSNTSAQEVQGIEKVKTQVPSNAPAFGGPAVQKTKDFPAASSQFKPAASSDPYSSAKATTLLPIVRPTSVPIPPGPDVSVPNIFTESAALSSPVTITAISSAPKLDDAPKKSSPTALPNFFASSPAFSMALPKPTTSPEFGGSLSRQASDRMSVEETSFADAAPKPSTQLFSPVNNSAKDIVFPTTEVAKTAAELNPFSPTKVEPPAMTIPFSFGSSPTKTAAPETLPFTPNPQILDNKVAPAFGVPTRETVPKVSQPSPLFAGNSPLAPFSFSAPSSPAQTPFAFNSTLPSQEASKTGSTPGFAFSATQPKATVTNAFSFGASESKPAAAPFAFGATPATPPTTTENKQPFAFSASAASAHAPFPFGATPSAPAASIGAFGGFGSTITARPVTPPSNQEQEVSMDESPTRELAKPTSGFNFGNGSSQPSSLFGQGNSAPTSTLFGQNASTSSPFAFGSPSNPAGNPFGGKPDDKVEPKPAMTFNAFGKTPPSSSSGFSFGQPVQSTGFAFATQQANATQTNPFGFGQPSSQAPSNPFGQLTNNPGSTPQSPNTFTNTGFAFPSSTSAVQPSGFSFGSQPASPAPLLSSLPANASGVPAAAGAFTFGATAPNAGPTLFTMGAAPTQPSPGPPGARQMRKLPARRGTGKR